MKISIEEFILKYQMLVKYLVNYYYNKVSEFGIEFDDLYQAGMLSLVECYSRYDSTKSSLGTFAYLNIKYGICNFINKNISMARIPEIIIVISANLNKKRTEFYSFNGRDMNMQEMLDFLKNECYTADYLIDEKFVMLLLKIEKYYLVNQKYLIKLEQTEEYLMIDEDLNMDDLLVSQYNLEEEAINNVLFDDIMDYIENNFKKQDVQILKENYGLLGDDSISMRNLAKKYGYTFQGIAYINKKIIKKVREKFDISE